MTHNIIRCNILYSVNKIRPMTSVHNLLLSRYAALSPRTPNHGHREGSNRKSQQLTGLRYVDHPLIVVRNQSKTANVVRDTRPH
jgi:hypothetical protein